MTRTSIQKYVSLYCLGIQVDIIHNKWINGFKNLKFISHNSECRVDNYFEESIIDHINHRNLEIYDAYITIYSRKINMMKIVRHEENNNENIRCTN